MNSAFAPSNRGGAVRLQLNRIGDYEQALWPLVRALDDPDLGDKMRTKLRAGLQDLLGSWRLDYLSICETDNLVNGLQRLRVQPLELRHIDEGQSLLEQIVSPGAKSALVTHAIERVNELIALVR